MEKQTVTRKDVAQKAGVSVSVVSRALNNSGYVQADKKRESLRLLRRWGTFLIRWQCHFRNAGLDNFCFFARI